MLENIVTYGFFGALALFALIEWRRPGRAFPAIRGWWRRGLVSLAVYVGLSTLAPGIWDAFLADHQLFDGRSLGIVGGALVGVLVLELGIYVWHRALHSSEFLWRWFHQMHHSAERVDVAGAFYFHPFDVLGFAFVGSFCLVFVVGLQVEAAMIANGFAAFCAIFQHANIRTPHWLGWFVGRPEMHALHHQRGVHRYNYSDLPFIDLLFGTYRNPKVWEGQAGFYDGASAEVGAMLVGRDVSRDPSASGIWG